MENYKEIKKWEVLTPTGWSKFDGVLNTYRDNYLKLFFSDGSDLECSFEHKLKLINNRKKEAIKLKEGDVLYSGIKVEKIEIINEPTGLYELINVKKRHDYYTNNVVSGNCAAISWMSEIWAAAGLTLTRSQGKCIAISCVEENTYVYTDKGIKQVKDFIPEGVNREKKQTYDIQPYSIRGNKKLRESNFFHVNGYCDTRKIETCYNSIESSLEHKYWSYKDGEYKWVKTKDLKVGDWLCHQYGMNIWGNDDDISGFLNKIENNRKKINIPDSLTPDWCYLLGLYIAEGSSNKKNSITISCGDDISEIFDKLGLNYYKNPETGVSYTINSVCLVEFFKFLGFNLNFTASKKEIPKRLLSLSKENTKALIQGIFDGDGYSTIKNNRVGINLKSPKLIEQIRIILTNFGILSTLSIVSLEKLNSYYSKKNIIHRHDSNNLEIDNHYATKFHKEIGFRLQRKIDTAKFNKRETSIIPNGIEIVKELCKIGKTSIDSIRTKHKIYIHYNGNPGKTNILKLINHLTSLDENFLLNPRVKEILDEVLIENTVWTQIKSIESGKNYTYDFSLPETEDKTWCHSIVYNTFLSHNTPKGSNGWYFDQYTNAKENDWNIINAHWTEHPIYNLGTYRWIDDKKHKDGGYPLFMNGNTFPDMTDIKTQKKYKCTSKKDYNYIRDGRIRSPWYDYESKRLGIQKTRCEIDCSFAGSGGEVLDPEVIRDLEILAKDFKQINEQKLGPYKSYKQYALPEPGCKYILVSDVATGDGSDYSAFVILNLNKFEIAATYKDQFDHAKYAEILNEKGREYYNATIIVEHQFGLPVLLNLRDIHNYKNLFYSTLKKEDPTIKEKKRKIGFWQTENTRTLGGAKLEEVLNKKELLIPSNDIIAELYNWIWSKRGRRDHAPGKNDDLIMALTMGMFYIFYINRKQEDFRDQMKKSIERNTVSLGDYLSDDDMFDQYLN